MFRAGLYLRLNSRMMMTAVVTDWPSLVPGLNRHRFTAATASASSPVRRSTERTTRTLETLPSIWRVRPRDVLQASGLVP
jgi:hypothetical protein